MERSPSSTAWQRKRDLKVAGMPSGSAAASAGLRHLNPTKRLGAQEPQALGQGKNKGVIRITTIVPGSSRPTTEVTDQTTGRMRTL